METFQIKPVTLEGVLVRLEPLSEAHIPNLAVAGRDESIWRYMSYGYLGEESAMRHWVADLLAAEHRGTDFPFTVIHRSTNNVIGATRYLDIRSEHRGLEIGGTWYAVEHQRTGVNTECKYLLLRHAFEVLGCIRVQLKTDSLNERSQRAIERLGAVHEGVLRSHMIMPDGRRRDSVYYSILDSEWPRIKERLLDMMRNYLA
jgi:RimJ/RimL family protein N-acetyltransferase